MINYELKNDTELGQAYYKKSGTMKRSRSP